MSELPLDEDEDRAGFIITLNALKLSHGSGLFLQVNKASDVIMVHYLTTGLDRTRHFHALD